jgi:hypothetical protein
VRRFIPKKPKTNSLEVVIKRHGIKPQNCQIEHPIFMGGVKVKNAKNGIHIFMEDLATFYIAN